MRLVWAPAPRVERRGVHTMSTLQHQPREQTGWVGWIAFAGVMMVILGIFHAIDGLTALFNDEFYVVGTKGLVLELDFTAWGVAHLLLGILLGYGAYSLFNGRIVGRTLGVIVATVSAVVNIGFIAAYPVWSVLMIALDVLIIFAITVHGRELQPDV